MSFTPTPSDARFIIHLSDVDAWIDHYNHDRTHSGKHCFGKTPMQTLKDSIPLALAKQLNQTLPTSVSALT